MLQAPLFPELAPSIHWCGRCGRALTHPRSRAAGYGPKCWRIVVERKERETMTNHAVVGANDHSRLVQVPSCRRCGGPLTKSWDPDEGETWTCENAAADIAWYQARQPRVVADQVHLTLTPELARHLADQLEDSSCQHRNWAEEHQRTDDWNTQRADALEVIMRQLAAQGYGVDEDGT